MPFGIIGRTGPGMMQVVGFVDRSTGGGTFGANLGCAIVTMGLYGVSVDFRSDARPSSQITLGRLVLLFQMGELLRCQCTNVISSTVRARGNFVSVQH